ncbi:MAG TPA: hypothetical protein VJH92_06615 [Candidatus Nanoarchaeia archaeon]|nr:hypothetical protein [Candidatus Nanoarchaeia archaeon]
MEKTLSIYWFVIIGIVATAIIIMVAAFYGSNYDVRKYENRALANHIADCISKEGKLQDYVYQSGFKQEFSDNFLEICNLNFNVEDTYDEEQYYVDVDFYAVDDSSNSLFSVSKGNINFRASCAIQEDESYKTLAQCGERRLYSTQGNEQFLIRIFTAIGKVSENVN